MKLEFLGEISDNGKFRNVVSNNVVRLFDFDKEDLVSLYELVRKLISGQESEIKLDKEKFIDVVNCTLKFVDDDTNSGICVIKERVLNHMVR